MIETQTKTYKKSKSEPCHCAEPQPGGACCDLICFERPNYFCGHLLTDTDLSTEQRYAIEKRKLHNRTLHGWGVVCGLRLTCDHECGGIMVDEGYAIDDCGNDLVVCQPLRFDVIGKLYEKGYLVGRAPSEPCEPPKEEDPCKLRQCFYVTICYEEEPRDFTTPFVAGCRPSLSECEPTRIREGVMFDVLCELPQTDAWLEDLFCRIKNCWKLFTEGQFANVLKTRRNHLSDALGNKASLNSNTNWWELFCTLRGLLLLYLSKHPDKYNCNLEYEIRKICFPNDPSYDSSKHLPNYDPGQGQGTYPAGQPTNYPQGQGQGTYPAGQPTNYPQGQGQGTYPAGQPTNYPQGQGQGTYPAGQTTTTQNYSGEIRDAFCRLLELAHQYVISCVLGEFIFACKEPCKPACVVLGTVEVVGNKVTHVCNCPRSYVWSFASFWEVVIAKVLGGIACEEVPHIMKPTPQPTDPGTPGTTPQPTPGTPGTTPQPTDPAVPASQPPSSTTSVPPTGEPRPGTDKPYTYDELTHICCSAFKFNCDEFFCELATPEAAFEKTIAGLKTIVELRESLRHAFDFTRPETFSPSTFLGMDVSQAYQRAKNLNVELRVEPQPLQRQFLSPSQTFLSNTLSGPERPIYAYQVANRIVEARAEWREEGLLDPDSRAEIDGLHQTVADLKKRLDDAQGDFDTLRKLREEISAGIAQETQRGAAKRPARRRGLGTQEGGENG